MLIAQITDLHIKTPGRLAYRVVDTADFLRRTVAHVNALEPRPDVAIATGDLVDGGLAEEYAHLRELLAPLAMPVFLIPGNHDDREHMLTAFAEHDYLAGEGGFMHYVVEGYPLRMIGLDTLVPGESKGALCDVRLAWLAQRLAEAPSAPTVIFMHHPPFRTGVNSMDASGLMEGEGELARIVSGHSQVQRVICGHVHRAIERPWAGTLACVAPSPGHQVMLDLISKGPSRFVMEPPACRLFQWMPGEGLVSHLSFVGEFDGPYPFREGGKRIE